ncbi:MAG: hypothetical protein LPK19_08945, partial [Hymenobacteraceae bacterium]|nr:hypothetical protein [Hymenobacteraceae bacterium]MDX5396347.1 hypothetical protein [Hymenobacteraceae bacterium]MDX5512408.1 hypothetical protein [Hymenobacteraceae bacterium]
VNQVTVQERMAPLVGINFKTKNQITTRLESRTERNLSLNLTNAQITQSNIKDYVIGIGYTTNKFRVPFRINGERKVLNNDLTARLDLSVRDNETLQRSIIRDSQGNESSQTQATNGNLQFQLRPTIDYVVNQRLNIQFFFTRNITDPKVDNAYKTTLTEGGIQLRYSLSQ